MLDNENLRKHQQTIDGRPFYERFVEIGNGQFFLLFCSPDDMTRLASARRWFFDGTFKVQPRIFQQLFTVHTKQGSSIMPCAYALLSHKSKELYTAFFQHLLQISQSFAGICHVREVTCDFETGFLPVIEQAFGQNITIKGCLFHFNQCLLRWVKSHGLQQSYSMPKSNVRKLVRKFMALPLLPLQMIRPAAQQLTNIARETCPEIMGFVDYFVQQWLNDISPEKWCVWNEFIRTNNAVEGKT